MFVFFSYLYMGYALSSVTRLFFSFFGRVIKFLLDFFLLKFYFWN